jgi:hypothetical protein
MPAIVAEDNGDWGVKSWSWGGGEGVSGRVEVDIWGGGIGDAEERGENGGIDETEVVDIEIGLIVGDGSDVVFGEASVEVGTGGGGATGATGAGLFPVFPNRSGTACRATSL